MNNLEIGKKLVALCKQGKNIEAIETLYSPEIVSVEPMSMHGMPAEMNGLEAVKGKSKWWAENNQVHSAKILGPFPQGDRFAVYFHYEITPKGQKEKISMEEVGIYTTRNDKIVREEFMYSGQ